MWVAFALQSLDANFNESLTNDVVSFEHLGPDLQHMRKVSSGPLLSGS